MLCSFLYLSQQIKLHFNLPYCCQYHHFRSWNEQRLKRQPRWQERVCKVRAGHSFGYCMVDGCMWEERTEIKLFQITSHNLMQKFSHKVVCFIRYQFFLMVLMHLTKNLSCGILAGTIVVTITIGVVSARLWNCCMNSYGGVWILSNDYW